MYSKQLRQMLEYMEADCKKMAQMIPSTISEQTISEAEKVLYQCLRDKLNNNYTIFHSYDLLTRNAKNKLIDGEIDFLFFCHDKGILALEVKGGEISYKGDKGCWYQNGIEMKMSPFKQAKEYKYKISHFLKTSFKKRVSVPVGYAVCFPNVYSDIHRLPAEADRDILITGAELPYIAEAISGMFAKMQENQGFRLTKADIHNIKLALAPNFE